MLILNSVRQILLVYIMIRVIVRIFIVLSLYLGVFPVKMLVLKLSGNTSADALLNIRHGGVYSVVR